LAQEVQAFGIRVAVVEPGVVVTPIFTKAKRFSDPASPYAVHVHRLLLFYQMQMKAPSQPADVARVIHEAVTTKESRLRYLVGDDAERLVAGRRRLTDEDYAATGRPMSDEETSTSCAVATGSSGRLGGDTFEGEDHMSTGDKITALNPMGFPPKVVTKPLAPRLSALDGKTVYLVDCRFDDSDVFLKQVQA